MHLLSGAALGPAPLKGTGLAALLGQVGRARRPLAGGLAAAATFDLPANLPARAAATDATGSDAAPSSAIPPSRTGAGNAFDDPSGGLPNGPAADGPDVADLIRRTQSGEHEAFGLIYDRYVELVYRFVLYRVEGNRAMAEDIVSETFLRALRSIGSFSEQGRDIGAWLITIARNLLVDHARSGRARLEGPAADIVDRADCRTVPGPEDAVLADIDLREVLAAVEKLRPEQRECLKLRFLQGLSVRETAAAMGKNEGAVRALQFRAMRSLARKLPAPETG